MTGEKCSFEGCFAPVDGYCQVCKRGFCKAHLTTENIYTQDGRMQYVTVCPYCYDDVKQGKYKGSNDSMLLKFILISVPLFIVLLGLLIAFLLGFKFW